MADRQLPYRGSVQTLGVVGTGVIGAGWAARALARGLDVVAWDPAQGAQARLRAGVDNAWPALVRMGLFPGADRARLRFETRLDALCQSVDFVQESAPDRLELKQSLHRQLASATPADVLIASSSSGLLPSEIQAECANPDRILIGHPFNPVYLLPLVELVGGELTDAVALDAAATIYRGLGMAPLIVRNEIEGYLSDRLQEALWRENLHLVNDGVATTEELDDAIIYGPGLRWAFMGVNKTFHLAGGDAGMRHMLEQFGPALELPWTHLKAPELTDQLIDAMVEGTQAQTEGQSVKELERLRDDCLVAIMSALRAYKTGAGNVMERDAAEREAAASAAGWQPGLKIATPLEIYRCGLVQEWIDYNGHLTAAAYPMAFDQAVEALFNFVHLDAGYRDTGHAVYTAETHFNYYQECLLGESFYFTAQLLLVDEKRIHTCIRMHEADGGELRASAEHMFLHVDTRSHRVAPMLAQIAEPLNAIFAAHADLERPGEVGRSVGQRR